MYFGVLQHIFIFHKNKNKKKHLFIINLFVYLKIIKYEITQMYDYLV